MKTFTEYLKEGTEGCSDCEYMKSETDGEIDTCDECAADEREKTNESVSEGFKIRDKSRGYGVSDKTYKTREEAKDAAVMKSASSGGDWEVIEETNEAEKRWKQTSMSPQEAIAKYGKENVKVKKGALRNGDDMVEVFVESMNEAGGYYTQPVYDMIEQHGIEKVMHELLTALDADVIQDALSRMGEGLGEEVTATCEDCGCTIGQPETGCECNNDAHTHAHEELDYLRKLAGI